MPDFYPLTLTLKARNGTDYVEVRLQDASRMGMAWETRSLDSIRAEVDRAENDYYVGRTFGEEPAEFGKKLYRWLDGDAGLFRHKMEEAVESGLFILFKIKQEGQLPNTIEHLPWELLHDGTDFLVRQYDFLPCRMAARRAAPPAPVSRALELLFMAASPVGGGSRLDYEREEAEIMRATKNMSILTEVEETGNLEQLKDTLRSAPVSVDIVHLSGHAGHDEGGPLFLTEDEIGGVTTSRPADITNALRVAKPPRLLFLSGCATGRGREETTSMAASVVGSKVPFVLAWAQPVSDRLATYAAGTVYRELAGQMDIAAATHATLNEMLNHHNGGSEGGVPWEQWHLLRLYAACDPTPLVDGSYTVRNRDYDAEFLDDEQKVKVPSRTEFIGRRRQIQTGLRHLLRAPDKELGVVLQGAGGLGKSSLAKRLTTRIRQGAPIVISGLFYEDKLIQVLSNKLKTPAAREHLNDMANNAVAALTRACGEEIAATGKFPVFVLDDFEQNFVHNNRELELIDGRPQRLIPVAETALRALLDATRALYRRERGEYPRIIVTCRYALPERFAADLPQITLASFQNELRDRLLDRKATKFEVKGNEHLALVAKTAAGNPRLLENLLRVLGNTDLDAKKITARLEEVATNQRLNLLTQLLLDHQSEEFHAVLELLATYEIPVAPGALIALNSEVVDVESHLLHGRDIGLIEELGGQGDDRYLLMDGVRAVRDYAESTKKYAAAATQHLSALDQSIREVVLPLELEIIRLGSLALLEKETCDIASQLGHRLHDTNQALAAVNLLEPITEIFPDNLELHHAVACSFQVIGETEKALRSFTIAKERWPKDEQGGKEYGAVLHNLAGLILQQGDPQAAMDLYQQSLEIDKNLGDQLGEGTTQNALARIILQQGNPEGAMNLFKESLEVFRRVQNISGEGVVLHDMANILLQQGDPDGAMRLYEQSLAIKEKLGDLRGKGATLHAMAQVILQQGDPDGAMRLCEQSLAILEKVGDLRGKGAILHDMAQVILQQGDPDGAKRLYERSLAIKEKVGDLQGKGATLHAMAQVILQQGDPDGAMRLYEQSLAIKEKVGDLRGKGATLHAMAEVILQQGDPDGAMRLYEQSLAIKEKVGDLRGKGVTLHAMAQVILQQGDPDGAMRLYEQSLAIKEKVGDLREKGATLHAMAQVILQQGDPDGAMNLYQQSLEIVEKVGDLQGKGATLHQMAQVILQQGDPQGAMKFYQQSLEIKEKMGDLRGKAMTLTMMGQLQVRLDKYPAGLDSLFTAFLLAVKTKSHEQKQILNILLSAWVESIKHSHAESAAESTVEYLNSQEGLDPEAINGYAREHGYLEPFTVREDGEEE